MALLLAAVGCSTGRHPSPPGVERATAPTGSPGGAAQVRVFRFTEDTVGFTNETRWIYRPAPGGEGMIHERREPEPTYSLRCFVVSRLNRQFFDHAFFDPAQPRVDEARLRPLLSDVIGRSSRRPSSPTNRVVIPGFSNLREFSAQHESLLKELGGPAWWSYAQRGHWRMIAPIGPGRERQEAARLHQEITAGRPAVVHLVRFPQLTINHAVLLFAAQRTADGFEFMAADPNDPSRPLVLTFDSREGRFAWPSTPYFAGGRVDAYEIFRNAWY